MAKIKTGPLIAEASGSVGGTTFSRNRYGQYTRQRRIPVNPNTVAQNAIRAAFTYVSQRWRDGLNAQMRNEWTRYAEGTPIIDVLGDRQILSGLAMFCRFNAHWYRVKSATVDNGPLSPGEAPASTMTITGDTTSGVQITAFTPGITAPNQASISRSAFPHSHARNFFGGPFEYYGMYSDADLPATVIPHVSCAVGQRWWLRCRVFESDGRVSPVVIAPIDITS